VEGGPGFNSSTTKKEKGKKKKKEIKSGFTLYIIFPIY
jgi:hypothetical protein